MANKSDVMTRVEASGAVAVLRGVPGEQIVPVAEALLAGGVTALEVTADNPDAIEMIADLDAAVGDEAVVGAGTVLDSSTAVDAIRAGAEFVVAPHFDPEVVDTCNRYGTVVAPGIYTPTEAVEAAQQGKGIRQHHAGGGLLKQTQVAEAGRAELEAVGGVRPVTHGADGKAPARGLHSEKVIPLGQLEAARGFFLRGDGPFLQALEPLLNDPQALAEALAQHAGAPDVRARLAAAGVRFVRERFAMEAGIDRLAARFGLPVTHEPSQERIPEPTCASSSTHR